MILIELKDLLGEPAAPYAQLTRAQLARVGEGHGLFIAESIPVIRSALSAGYRPVSVLTERKHLCAVEEGLGELLGAAPVYTADPEKLEELTGYRLSRGVLCAMERKPLPSPESITEGARRIAVLEGISDPTNIGAIMRSAAGLGMDAVLLASNCCDPLHRRAARVSMGAVFRVPWTIIPCRESSRNAVDLDAVRRMGFKTAAAALKESSLSADSQELKAIGKLALLIGAEGPGLDPETISSADHTVMIPMYNGVDSLNAAAASAVLFWEIAGKMP